MVTRNTSSTASRWLSVLASAMLLVVALAGRANAQAPTTFHACYVPDVGAMYLIQLPGLPTECLSGTHVQITWTEGGDVADGSITTLKLADGAVTTVKVADQAVTSAKIGSDVPLPPGTCSTDQIITWDGSAWVCADASGISGLETVTTLFIRDTPGGVTTETFVTSCPAGKDVFGGGYAIRIDFGSGFEQSDRAISASRPAGLPGWAVTLRWEVPIPGYRTEITVYAICASVAP
ncbi:MAG: hypothetical protein JSW71_07070 [Gemmatimonadota bacterium]|nr:MAG: hypothetical protein JSW71_07070 [Gemmatimonadota bacterium]